MRTLGIDHGDVRIGLALSDETGLVARPLCVLTHTTGQADAEAVARLVSEHGVQRVVVGLPTDSEGRVGHQGRKVERWAEALGRVVGVPVELWDESFSSGEALALKRRRRKRAGRLDAQAAAVILQSYLDADRAA